jgi:hypothetical protein
MQLEPQFQSGLAPDFDIIEVWFGRAQGGGSLFLPNGGDTMSLTRRPLTHVCPVGNQIIWPYHVSCQGFVLIKQLDIHLKSC